MYIARFKTAYHQREKVISAKLSIDAPAIGSNANIYQDNEGKSVLGLPVGTMLSYDASTNTFTEVKATVSTGVITAAPAVTLGNYIIAQSDATIGGGHVPVETLSYKYIGKCDFVGASAVEKNIAVFEITDVEDVVIGDIDKGEIKFSIVPLAGTDEQYGKTVSSLQSDIVISNNMITGISKYVADYSSAGFEGAGNYLAIKANIEAGTTVKVSKRLANGTTTDEVTLVSDDGYTLTAVITNVIALIFKVIKDGQTKIFEYSLAGVIRELS